MTVILAIRLSVRRYRRLDNSPPIENGVVVRFGSHGFQLDRTAAGLINELVAFKLEPSDGLPSDLAILGVQFRVLVGCNIDD